MNPKMEELIPAAQLDADFGGDYDFEYKHDVYLPAICKFCGIADDGTRTKERPGPVRTETADTQATPAPTPGLAARPDDAEEDSRSSQTAVSQVPSRVGPAAAKKDAEPSPSTKRTRSPSRGPWYMACFPSHASDAHHDNEKEGAKRARGESDSSSVRSSAGSSMMGALKPKSSKRKKRKSVTDPETVTDPAETAEMERRFKAGEPRRVIKEGEPEILKALDVAVQREARDEAPLPLLDRTASTASATGGLQAALDKVGLAPSPSSEREDMMDTADRALAMIKAGNSGEVRKVMRQPSADHAQMVSMPPAPSGNPTLGDGELVFEVSSRDQP